MYLSNEIEVNKRLLSALAVFLIVLGVVSVYAFNAEKSTSAIRVQPQQPVTKNPEATQQKIPQIPNQPPAPTGANSIQDISIHANAGGNYDKNRITVQSGVPVRLHFTADPNAGCGRQIVIYGLNVNAVSQSGEEKVVEFTPTTPGSYTYSCGMRMWGPGTLVVQ